MSNIFDCEDLRRKILGIKFKQEHRDQQFKQFIYNLICCEKHKTFLLITNCALCDVNVMNLVDNW